MSTFLWLNGHFKTLNCLLKERAANPGHSFKLCALSYIDPLKPTIWLGFLLYFSLSSSKQLMTEKGTEKRNAVNMRTVVFLFFRLMACGDVNQAPRTHGESLTEKNKCRRAQAAPLAAHSTALEALLLDYGEKGSIWRMRWEKGCRALAGCESTCLGR